MMRWVILICLFACNGNGNGIHDVKNGGDADEDIDVHASTPGVWYCVRITHKDGSRTAEPCYETLAKCESEYAAALGNMHSVVRCQRHTFALCFEWQSEEDGKGWSCYKEKKECDDWREQSLAAGQEASDCLRVPPEGWKKSSSRLRLRQRRMAER